MDMTVRSSYGGATGDNVMSWVGLPKVDDGIIRERRGGQKMENHAWSSGTRQIKDKGDCFKQSNSLGRMRANESTMLGRVPVRKETTH